MKALLRERDGQISVCQEYRSDLIESIKTTESCMEDLQKLNMEWRNIIANSKDDEEKGKRSLYENLINDKDGL